MGKFELVCVIDIVTFQEQGMTPGQMVEEFPSLESTIDVYAALVYYADHKDEIEAEYEEGQHILAEAEQHRLEALKSRQS